MNPLVQKLTERQQGILKQEEVEIQLIVGELMLCSCRAFNKLTPQVRKLYIGFLIETDELLTSHNE